ncbi:MAG: amidase [Alphaproteobacteria bacterium]|nr:amidase [Alphaproteobacteria bacterium]
MVDLTKKGPMGLNGLTASEASAKLASGEITSEALTRDCLDRIAARDGDVHAWDYIDPDYAIAQAKSLDGEPRRGPLHGVPVGIKDIFDTKDMPTGHGFGPYQGKEFGVDSNCVAQLRDGGMVIMGKTVTTEFACPKPRHTLNPHDPTRTPGVSSSGSAASVADYMVPLANGTQTGGSVIGPAANCGVYGYKASLDGIDRGNFRHCKKSIDTIGLFARSMEDLILMRQVQTGAAPGTSTDKPRIAVLRAPCWDKAEPPMQAAVEQAAVILKDAGALISDFDLPQVFTDIIPDAAVINAWEASIMLETEIRENIESFNDHNLERIDWVKTLGEEDYINAGKAMDAARAEMDVILDGYDLVLSPSLEGEAPVGLTEVRSGTFARLWTQMYTPSVNLPLFESASSLPICIQLVGKRNTDDAVLANAQWADGKLRAALGDIPVIV